MPPSASKALLLALTLALALLAPSAATGKEVRFPETGVPAYAIVLPDDWITQPADDGNLLLFSANRTAVMVVLVAVSTEPLDKIAKEALEIAPAVPDGRKNPTEISGCEGFTWFGTMKNDKNATLNLEMSIVRIDPEHVASASLLLASDTAPVDITAARLVRSGLKLLKR